jgi:hypothetical protein
MLASDSSKILVLRGKIELIIILMVDPLLPTLPKQHQRYKTQ